MRLNETLKKNDDVMGYNPFNESYAYNIYLDNERIDDLDGTSGFATKEEAEEDAKKYLNIIADQLERSPEDFHYYVFEDEDDLEEAANNSIARVLDLTNYFYNKGFTIDSSIVDRICKQLDKEGIKYNRHSVENQMWSIVDEIDGDVEENLEEAVPHIITRKEAVAKLLEFGDLEAVVKAMTGDQAIDIARALGLF